MATVKLIQQLQTPAGSLNATIEVTAGAVAHLDAEAIAAATDAEIEIAFPYANIKAYYLLSTVSCTVETNSSSAPDDSISLTANVPKTYITGGGMTSEFTADVTSIFVTAAAAGTLTIYVAYDPTP